MRIFLLHHVTWSINSVCHFFGRRRFAIEDHSTNVFWLALPSFGESWHHNHHAFPRSAVHGLAGGRSTPSALVIRAMKRLGLAWNVVRDHARAPGAEDGGEAARRRRLGGRHPAPPLFLPDLTRGPAFQ